MRFFSSPTKPRRIQAHELIVDDWGILNPLIALHRNRLPLVLADQSFLGARNRRSRSATGIKRLAEETWIGHTPEFQQWAGVNDRIVRSGTRSRF